MTFCLVAARRGGTMLARGDDAIKKVMRSICDSRDARTQHTRRHTVGTWDMIRDERASLVAAFATLPATAWNAPSLATGWSNRDVLAHLIATAQMTPPKFFGAMIGSRFDFKAMSNKRIADVRAGKTDDQLIDAYRSL